VCATLADVGIGCVLFLWLFLGAAAAVASIVGALMLGSGVRRRRGGRAVVGGVLAMGGAVIVVVAAMFVTSWVVVGSTPLYSTSPSVFRTEFGYEPAGVTSIQSETSGSTDSTLHFMRFRTAPATIQKITSGRFKAVPFAECERQFRARASRRPTWWAPVRSGSSRCYVAAPFDGAFAMNEAWIGYDAESGYAHYFYIGID
jgi:hypothetical protein